MSRYARSQALLERAARVIPGGIYGHTAPVMKVPGRFPAYARSASGCRTTDVDGNTYIDFMCAYGPIVLGHNHPEVEEAAARQQRDGNCFNHPTERMVELAEALTSRTLPGGWAVFGKNGSDMTTWSLQAARAATGRPLIARIRGAYHGAHAWCSPGHAGIIEEDRRAFRVIDWNDAGALESLVQREGGSLAALILTPFHHPAYGDSADPSPEFIETVHRLRDRYGFLLIIDDIRGGFRLDRGGSHRVYGWRPDLLCFCKALGNGHPIAACIGQAALKPHAAKVFLTGSYWNSAVPMAAALKVLDLLDRDQVPARLEAAGLRLRDGLLALGRKFGQPIVASGPPAAPTYRFEGDPGFIRFEEFCSLAMEEGIYFHPHHNWFLCAAHTDADIDLSLAAAERAFTRLADTTAT